MIAMADPGFPEGGASFPDSGVPTYFAIFAKNCMKMKEFELSP